MNPKQEPKYEAVGEWYDEAPQRPGEGKHHRVVGQLVNRATGEAIPDDEPVFVFRARDIHAVDVLDYYYSKVAGGDDAHRLAVRARYEQFVRFGLEHPDRLKRPD